MKKSKQVEVFMDGIDWQHEIGEALGGNLVYPSLEDAIENNKCAKSCGVVKVRVELIEWALEQNWDNAEYISMNVDDIKKNKDLQLLECATAHLKYLEERAKKQKNKVNTIKEKLNSKTKTKSKK